MSSWFVAGLLYALDKLSQGMIVCLYILLSHGLSSCLFLNVLGSYIFVEKEKYGVKG